MGNMTRIAWWQWLPFFRWRIVAIVESADDVPTRLPRNGAVLVGSKSYPKWIVFDCPCRRGHRIMLNSDRGRMPYWSSTVEGRLTISPSVDSHQNMRRCHYFIRNGRVEWVYERSNR
jgi:hypothetical protein